MSEKSIPLRFKPIFWDTDFVNLDLEKSKLYIISRMYCKGGFPGIYWVEHNYSEEDIIKAAKNRRDLYPIIANHLRKKYGLEKSQMKYYSLSFDWRNNGA